jgi:hypothetical protein
VFEHGQLDAIQVGMVPTEAQREPERVFAETLTAKSFLANSDPEFRRPVHAVDIRDLDVADDGGLSSLSDREYDSCRILADGLAPLSMADKIDGAVGEVEPRRDNIIGPTK